MFNFSSSYLRYVFTYVNKCFSKSNSKQRSMYSQFPRSFSSLPIQLHFTVEILTHDYHQTQFFPGLEAWKKQSEWTNIATETRAQELTIIKVLIFHLFILSALQHQQYPPYHFIATVFQGVLFPSILYFRTSKPILYGRKFKTIRNKMFLTFTKNLKSVWIENYFFRVFAPARKKEGFAFSIWFSSFSTFLIVFNDPFGNPSAFSFSFVVYSPSLNAL